MGTRGSWGFIIDGTRWETYVHYDAYPSHLGDNLLGWAREVQDWAPVITRVTSLTVVQESDHPSGKTLAALTAAGIADPNVSTGADYYSAMRNAQGDPSMTLDARLWVDGTDFHKDPLWCEWSYVFNLDTRTFDVYESVCTGGSNYGQVRVASHALDALPESLGIAD